MVFNGDHKRFFESGQSPQTRDIDPNSKRPGITEIVRRLRNDNPEWSLEKATAKAKTLWAKGVRE